MTPLRIRPRSTRSPAEELAWQMKLAIRAPFQREWPFASELKRKHRFDFAFLDRKLAAECDGAIWKQGRHTRGSGYTKDCEKFALAAILGWRVIRVTPAQIRSGQALKWIERALLAL